MFGVNIIISVIVKIFDSVGTGQALSLQYFLPVQ